jgi:hypothetical protein
MRLRKRVVGLLAGCMLAAGVAHAQTPPSSSVTAEALFEDGRRLMTEGKYTEACPKFAAAERLDPSTATLLNLASCYEKQGRTATAWATYKEAASAASAAGRKDYLSAAERHASGLAQRLARLTLVVPHPVDGLRVERDGVAVDRAEWGIAIPIDPGSHSLAASAPGYKGWTSAVAVAQDGAQVTLTVPALDLLPVEVPTPKTMEPQAATVPSSTPAEPPGDADSRSGSSTRTTVAWVVAGVGVVGLAVGTVFAVDAKNKYNDSLLQCEMGSPNLCTRDGVSSRNDARSAGDAATLAFGLGAAAVVAGGVLWLTAPSSASTKATGSLVLTPTLGGASLRGTW